MPRFEAVYASRRDAANLRPDPAVDGRVSVDGRAATEGRLAVRKGVDIDTEKGLGGACRPWIRLERDQKRFESCMAIAEKIGEIGTPKKAFEILKEAAGSEDVEVGIIMTLDTHLRLRGLAEIGRGEIDSVMIPTGPALRIALLDGAQGVILAHTHPTLYTEPSESDIEVTKSFDEACKAVNLFFADHLVIGGWKQFYSFADHGYLDT